MSASPSDIDQTKPIVEMPSIEPKPVVVETAPMQIDDLNSSETRLQLASQNAQSSEDFRKVAEESLALSSDSLKFQNRTAAIRLSLLAEQAAQSSKDVALIRSTTANITKYVVATKTINVTANRNWQAAADVRKGDVVAMTATGTWHTWPDGGENWKSDANGTKFNAGKTFPLPGAKQGALLGKIGSTPFVVGRSAVIEVQNSGRLEMINNDDVRRSDNRGAISVEIRVLR